MKKVFSNRLFWPVVALFAILLFNFLFTQDFFKIQIKDGRLFGSIIDILNRGAPVMLLSIGMTLVIATGGVDLSVGAIMAIAGAIAALLVAKVHTSVMTVVLVSLAASCAAGLWNGMLVGYLGIQPIVATLILMVSGRGIAQLLSRGQIIIFEHHPFEYVGGGFLLGLPFTIFIVAAVLLITILLTRRTAIGLYIESVGANPTASHYAGINVKLIKLLVYVFSGLCAGIAGLIVTSDIRAADANNAGLYLELDAILCVVIGGTALTGGRFYLAGSILGALILQAVTTTILTRGVPPEFALVVKAMVVVTVCLLQSEQFRGKVLNKIRRSKQ